MSLDAYDPDTDPLNPANQTIELLQKEIEQLTQACAFKDETNRALQAAYKGQAVLEAEVATLTTSLDQARAVVEGIQGALGTEETGDALIEVARNAHRAEQASARTSRESEHG